MDDEITIGDIIGQTYPPTYGKGNSNLDTVYLKKKKNNCKNCKEMKDKINILEDKIIKLELKIKDNIDVEIDDIKEKIKRLETKLLSEEEENIIDSLKRLMKNPGNIKSRRDFNILNRATYMNIAQPFPFVPQEKLSDQVINYKKKDNKK